MATLDDLQAIARELNRVTTAGQARLAIGACLRAVGRAYPLLDKIFDHDTRFPLRHELDAVRVNLEAWFDTIKADGAQDFTYEWNSPPWGRNLIYKAYGVVAAIEGAAGATISISALSELAAAIEDAPRVFSEALGKALQKVAETAGQTVAGLGKGLGSGLGLGGLAYILLAVAVVAVVVTRGGVIGQARRVLLG